MPGDEYGAAVSGGLKLKGVGSGSKVSKQRRKKVKPVQPAESKEKKLDVVEERGDGAVNEDVDGDMADGEAGADMRGDLEGKGSRERSRQEGKRDNEEAIPLPPLQRAGKTEAELRHEERRRRRVCYSTLWLYIGGAVAVGSR